MPEEQMLTRVFGVLSNALDKIDDTVDRLIVGPANKMLARAFSVISKALDKVDDMVDWLIFDPIIKMNDRVIACRNRMINWVINFICRQAERIWSRLSDAQKNQLGNLAFALLIIGVFALPGYVIVKGISVSVSSLFEAPIPKFGIFTCHTPKCVGHRAGYDWAEANDIDDPRRCPTRSSQSFFEGCITFTQSPPSYDYQSPPSYD
jgi:hypothetical protein